MFGDLEEKNKSNNKEMVFMVNTIGGTIFISLGCIFLILSKQIAHKTAGFYYNLLHVHFSEKKYQFVFLLVGMVFVIVGLLSVLRIIKFK